MKHSMLLAVAGLACSLAQAASGLKPGMWEIATQTALPSGLGQGQNMPKMPSNIQIPPEVQAKMAQKGIQLGSVNVSSGQVTLRHCLTKEEAERDQPPAAASDKNCKPTSYTRSGNTITYQVTCTGEHAATGTGRITINSPESYSGTNTVTAQTKQGPMSFTTNLQGRWVGACN